MHIAIKIHILVCSKFVTIIKINLSKNKVDAILWITKYFIIDSEDMEFELCINGKNTNIETSKPIHIVNQLFEVMVIITPIFIILNNSTLEELK